MITDNGPCVTYELVHVIFKKDVFKLGKDGFYSFDCKKRGVLIKSTSLGQVMYLRPEDVLEFKCDNWRKKNENI